MKLEDWSMNWLANVYRALFPNTNISAWGGKRLTGNTSESVKICSVGL